MTRYALQSISAMLTALYLLTSVGSCSVRQEGEVFSPVENLPIETPSQVTVNILQSAGEISLPLQQAVEAYAPEGVTFHVHTVASREDYRAALRSKLLAGEQVDLFHLLDVDDVERLEEHLEDLSPLSWAADGAGGTLGAVTREGKLYGVPHSLEGIGLVVNRAIFEAAGIPLEGITGFERLSAAFEALQSQIDRGELAEAFPQLEAVTDLAAQDTGYLGDLAAEVMLWGAFPSPVLAHASPALDLPGGESAEGFFKLLASFSPKQEGWKGLASVSRTRMIEGGLAAGRVAAVLESTQVYRRVYAANPDLEGRLALLPIYLPDSEEGVVFTGAPAWWAVNKGASDDAKEAASGLLTWLYQSEEGKDFYAREFGALSPYQKAEEASVTLYRQLLQAVDRGLAAPRLAPEAPGTWGEEVFAAGLQEYLTVYQKEWAQLTRDCKEGWGRMRTQE